MVHRIVKRGTQQSSHPFNVIKEVEFKVLGRHFRIILHPQRDVLHSNFKAYSVDGDGNEKIVHFGKFNRLYLFFIKYNFESVFLQTMTVYTVDEYLVNLIHRFEPI